jgi:hypothetical protein
MARAAVTIPRVLYTGTAHRINIVIYSDSDRQTRKDITGETIQLLVKDLGGTLRTYTATIDSAADGEAHAQLNSLNHTTAGAADAELVEDGVPIESYSLTFQEKLS